MQCLAYAIIFEISKIPPEKIRNSVYTGVWAFKNIKTQIKYKKRYAATVYGKYICSNHQ